MKGIEIGDIFRIATDYYSVTEINVGDHTISGSLLPDRLIVSTFKLTEIDKSWASNRM